MVRIPTHGPPTHPGEMLIEEFLKPLGLSQSGLAERLGVSYPRINELVHGKRGVTPDTVSASSAWRRSSGSTSNSRGTFTRSSIRGRRETSERSGASPAGRGRSAREHEPRGSDGLIRQCQD